MSIAAIIGVIKSIASIFKNILITIEEVRDYGVEKKTREIKKERNQLTAQMRRAIETGASDEDIADIHRRMVDNNNRMR